MTEILKLVPDSLVRFKGWRWLRLGIPWMLLVVRVGRGRLQALHDVFGRSTSQQARPVWVGPASIAASEGILVDRRS
jgi:hypothetical protein